MTGGSHGPWSVSPRPCISIPMLVAPSSDLLDAVASAAPAPTSGGAEVADIAATNGMYDADAGERPHDVACRCRTAVPAGIDNGGMLGCCPTVCTGQGACHPTGISGDPLPVAPPGTAPSDAVGGGGGSAGSGGAVIAASAGVCGVDVAEGRKCMSAAMAAWLRLVGSTSVVVPLSLRLVRAAEIVRVAGNSAGGLAHVVHEAARARSFRPSGSGPAADRGSGHGPRALPEASTRVCGSPVTSRRHAGDASVGTTTDGGGRCCVSLSRFKYACPVSDRSK
jgi:hypothetical protein